MAVNKCIFIGRLGKDPETRYLPNSDAVCNFSIAIDESYKDKSGVKQEKTEWVNIVAYRKLGEICGEYLKKGSQVYIEGRLQTRKWEKEGVTRYSTEIIAEQMQMLGVKGDNNSQGDSNTPRQENNAPQAHNDGVKDAFDGFDDSPLPF